MVSNAGFVAADSFQAADLARSALIEDQSINEYVGELIGIEVIEAHLHAYIFAANHPGYLGWKWQVTIAKLSENESATICDIVLLPGENSLLAPDWIPYQDRLLPGDLKPGDIIPTAKDDKRLVPASAALPEDEELNVFELFELGAGKARVLSVEGRDLASKRWHAGAGGPNSPYAISASKNCASCGFYIPLSGGLRKSFGVCANMLAPDDGKVVSIDHGCGAHSENLVR
jgi:hypothetical protein